MIKEYLLAAAVCRGGCFLLLWRLVATKKKNWNSGEGMVLIGAYLVFVVVGKGASAP